MKSLNIGAVRSATLAAFALPAVVLLAGLFMLACGDSDDESMDPGTEMKGFFLSILADGTLVCSTEDHVVHLQGDETTGRLDVRMGSTGPEFEQTGGHVGQKVIETDSSGNVVRKTIVTSYTAVNSDGVFEKPGAYYLVSTKNENIIGPEEIAAPRNQSEIFVGFWTGKPWRPAATHPAVVCPYVLVPADAGNNTSQGYEAPLTCGTSDQDWADMSPGLKDYLGPNPADETRNLGHCYKLFDENGKFRAPIPVN